MSAIASRRTFFRDAGALAGIFASRRGTAKSSIVERAEPDAHEVEPPPSLSFRTMTFEKTSMLGKTAVAIAAVPRDLPQGARLPLVVLLPGGVHTKQRPDRGCWGWFCDFKLGEVETALRRGVLSREDFRGFVDDAQLATINADLSATPYRGAVIVTPWVLNRQTNPVPHGTMVTPFLRALVERARAELPVLGTREATGLGGVSVGGLWALYCGSPLADLFGTLVAAQPFTEDLDRLLRKTIRARPTAQRVRIVTALGDRLRPMNVQLVKQLRKDGLELELVEYPGYHNALFPAGPGGIDMMLTFDRGLRVGAPAAMASATPSVFTSAMSSAMPSATSTTTSTIDAAPAVVTPPRANVPEKGTHVGRWLALSAVAAVASIFGVIARRRRRPLP